MTEIQDDPSKRFVQLLGKKYPVILCNIPNVPPDNVLVNDHSPAEVTETPITNSVQPQTVAQSQTLTMANDNTSGNGSESSVVSSVTENQTPAVVPEIATSTPSEETASKDLVGDETNNIEVEEDILDVVNMAAELDEETSSLPTGREFNYEAPAENSGNEANNQKAAVLDIGETNKDDNGETTAVGNTTAVENGKSDVCHNDTTENDQDVIAATSSNSSEEADNSEATQLPSPHQESPIILPEEVTQLETPSDPDPGQLVSISGKLDILDYANAEWKGSTYTAQCLRKGYKMLIKATGCKFLRLVRGDNYCALRATAFQILTQKLDLFQNISNWEQHIGGIVQRLKTRFEWITQWSFAERLPSTATNRTEVMENCLTYFVEQLKLSKAIASDNDRQQHFSALFNSGSTVEIKLFEALKLLLLDTAVKLHDANMSGEEVPVFAWLLFARDTSIDPKNLMLNHLNPAGNSGGLEQVEMCLLGQALQVAIKVVRPSNVEQEDFVTYYPDHMVDKWDKINLIAEDDRHYNIAVS